MTRAEDYRRFAAECLALAQRTKVPEDRLRLLEMARAWSMLAVKADERENERPSDCE